MYRAHGGGLIKVRDSLDLDSPAFDLAKCPVQDFGQSPPVSGTIGTKAYQDFAVPIRLRIHARVPMFPMQPKPYCLKLIVLCIHIVKDRTHNAFLSDRARRA